MYILSFSKSKEERKMTYLPRMNGLITFLAVCLLVSSVFTGAATAAPLTAAQANEAILNAGGSQAVVDAVIAAIEGLGPDASPANVARAIAEAANAAGADTALIEGVIAAAVAAAPEAAAAIAASVNAGVPEIGVDIIAAAAGVTPTTVADTPPEAYEPPAPPAVAAPTPAPTPGPRQAPPLVIPGGTPPGVDLPPVGSDTPASPI
jgi:hypothetical protein